MRKLPEKTQETLDAVIEFMPPGEFFSAKDLSSKAGKSFSAASLNALYSRGLLEKFDTTPKTYSLKTENSFGKEKKESSNTSMSRVVKTKSNLYENVKRHLVWLEEGISASPDSEVGIYKIIDKTIGQIVYIGKTEVAFQSRWKQHKEDLEKGTHHCAKLQERFNALGGHLSNFSFEVEVPCVSDPVIIDENERICIQKYDAIFTLDNTMKPEPKSQKG